MIEIASRIPNNDAATRHFHWPVVASGLKGTWPLSGLYLPASDFDLLVDLGDRGDFEHEASLDERGLQLAPRVRVQLIQRIDQGELVVVRVPQREESV